MHGLAGSSNPGVDPMRTLLKAVKWFGYSPWKLTSVSLRNFDARKGFNFAQRVREFLGRFASGSLKELHLHYIRANAMVSMTHGSFFEKLPDLEVLTIRSTNEGGFLERLDGD